MNPVKLYVFLVGVFIGLSFNSSALAQKFDYRSEEAKQLELDLFELNNQEKYSESQQLIKEFLEQEDLADMDRYYAHILRSYLYKRLFNYDQVFVELDMAEEAGMKSAHPDFVHINVQHERALALFDVYKYDESEQVMLDIQDQVQDFLHEESLSMYYMQFGYFAYLRQDYHRADSIYDLAEYHMKRSGPCHLPIIYTKRMKVYAETDRENELIAAENAAHHYADSCKIAKYTMLIYEWGRDISEKRGDFEAYLSYQALFDSMDGAYKQEAHNLELKKLDKKYESDLKDREIASISESNRRLWIFLMVVTALLIFVTVLIVQLVRGNKKLKKRELELAELDKLNKEIFVIISHDFKEPLIGFNFLLSRLQLEMPSQFSYYQDLKTQLQLTTQVLQNLIDWASSELEFRSGERHSVHLRDRVQVLIDNLEPLWRPKEILIVNEVAEDCEWKIDPFVLEIAVRNMVVNAVKFSEKGQEVRICFKDNALQVIDQGPGIADDLLSRLFSTKVQSSVGTNRESGSGIGLFITSALLRKNGFNIHAKNNDGIAGATFSISPAV